MDIKDIKALKDKVYELEGLLELAQLREDRMAELEPLILSRLHDLCGAGEADEAGEPDKAEENVAPEVPEISEEQVALTTTVEQTYATPVADDEKISILTDTLFPEEEPKPAYVPISAPESVKPRRLSYPAQDKLPPSDFSSTARKPAFCLNDRFRFRRELFGNSDADFSAAMNMVASMESYEEAEEYFLGELGWSQEKPEVVDFLAVISQYFGK